MLWKLILLKKYIENKQSREQKNQLWTARNCTAAIMSVSFFKTEHKF